MLPNELRQWPQFVLYKLVPSTRKPGKMDKLPVAPFDRSHDVKGINSQNPYWWVDMDTAVAQAQALGPEYGVTFVITDRDPFFLLDIDNCSTPNGWSHTAIDLCNRLAGAYVEVSQSGNGLHIMGRTQAFDHGCRNDALGLELYTHGRFVAMTGVGTNGSIDTDCTAPLQQLAAELFQQSKFDLDEWTDEPRADWMGYTDDNDLISRALDSASVGSAFGARATFSDLWHRNVDKLAAAYPDDGREFNESSADQALAQHLAFWTGADCERMHRLMLQSGLVREKWDEDVHASYLRRTILKAATMQEDVHKLVQLEPKAAELSDNINNQQAAATTQGYEPVLVSGFQYLPVDSQIEHFKGCVYVQKNHCALTPDGSLLKPDQFRATYGGYVFALDANNDKQTKNAWEAFVESQAIRFPKVHQTWFRPDLPFGHIEQHEGRLMVNSYIPIEQPRAQGDVTPFLNHLAKLLPDQRDRDIVLYYMAAIVQFKGHKFQWAPLIQGAEGNGKSLLSKVVEYCVSERYSHFPRADEIGEKFNDWLFDKIFIGVEDVYVPEQKRELLEVLKPMITANRLAKRAMQAGQVMEPLCANFIFNSNHKDALRKTKNDRRTAVFFCAQQSAEDIERDFEPGYFPKIYTWLREGGYSMVNDYLLNLAIPAELNPAVEAGGQAHRAPITSATEEAVNASLGRVEQEVLEAIDEQRPGFAGGWVSSKALDDLLDQINASTRIPRNKRRDMMQTLGYDYHPALAHTGGRLTTTTNTDGNKPRLYVKKGHPNVNFSNMADIVAAYDKAQTEGANKAQDPVVRGAFNQ